MAPMPPKAPGSGTPLPIPRRIVRRRKDMGLTGLELAGRAGISAAYLSMIEAGKKVPSEKIAVRIAEALGDDPDLYRAWAGASRVGDLGGHLEQLRRLRDYRSDPETVRRIARGEDLPDLGRPARQMAVWLHEEAADYGRRETIPVPLLDEGADPGSDPLSSPELLDVLELDAALLPADLVRPFAYRPTARITERVRDLINPGDLVVLDSRPARLSPERIQAVRSGGSVILSRVLLKGRSLLLLPAEGSSDFDVVELEDPTALESAIAGTVVVTVRTWTGTAGRPSIDQPEIAKPPSFYKEPTGRKTSTPRRSRRDRWKLEEGRFLVRDCDWKPKYGWRPVQRPEDMDFLNENPGTLIRFRLIKEGVVRYFLEMDGNQWREALGDYYEGDTWRRNGYIVAITQRRGGEYTETFQDRWARYVRSVT